jgi:hypothetical protein
MKVPCAGGILHVHDTPHCPSHYRLPTLYSKHGFRNEPPRLNCHSILNSVWTRMSPGEGHRDCTRTGHVSCDCRNYERRRENHNLGVSSDMTDHALRDVGMLMERSRQKEPAL